MRLRARPELRVAAVAAIAVACVLVLRGSSTRQPPARVVVPTTRSLVGDAHAPVSLGRLVIVVLRAPSVAARLSRGRPPTEQNERSWSAEDYAAQQQVLTELARHGLGARPLYSFARVLDGFSARLNAAAVALLGRDPEVAGVYPVVVGYPATLSSGPLDGGAAVRDAGVGLAGLDGTGVSIALLDTGVDPATPYLAGHVAPAIDVVGSAEGTHAPGPAPLEARGTELAGLMVGSGGPGGMHGVAPGASVLPIRIAGWQPDGHGGEALYARSDQLIAGLDRAVDPSGQGDVQLAARVALVDVAEPFGGFADSPEAQAVSGALALGLLVVAPAGNDGVAGPWYGSLAGPGGSPAALTVGAVDSRPEVPSERLVVHQGADVIADGAMPLLAQGPSRSALELPLAAPGSHVPLRGSAALVEAGADPVSAVARAIRAGARAVLLEGEVPAPGLLGSLGVPVLWASPGLVHTLGQRLPGGAPPAVAFGGVRAAPNPRLGTLAPFSSRGLAFDGRVDPELSAPGVELATADPGPNRYTTVSGTGAAAAIVAGAAALLVQARPDLSAAQVASLIAGSARPGGFQLPGGGTGQLDVGASAVGELAASTTSLGFGAWAGAHWHAARGFLLANVSSRALKLGFNPGSTILHVVPASLTLAAGASARVRVVAAVRARPLAQVAAGTLVITPSGGRPLRIPWAIGSRPPRGGLLHALAISPPSFAPSETTPARLRVVVGALPGGSKLEVEPAARLEIRLYGQGGTYLGLLANLHDLLPGSYRFAITGRGPGGGPLAPGNYRLALVAWPTLGGGPTRARIAFRIQ